MDKKLENIGEGNTGNNNIGNNNSGDGNTGSYNSGDENSGDWNSGCFNTGCWNAGDFNAGYFCDESGYDDIRAFNKPTGLDWNSWYVGYMGVINKLRRPLPGEDTCLSTLLGPEDIEHIKRIPNFDPEIFEECTGWTMP